jgi:Domain of unknown function DUF29
METEAATLYETDFFEWTARTSELLRQGRFGELDVEHLAEEIEDMGKSERRALMSRVRVLLVHLLKWNVQTERQSRSWQGAILEQRQEIEQLLEEMPSQKVYVQQVLTKTYVRAVNRASVETGLAASAFPAKCPFTLEQILNPEFLP